MPNIHRSSFFFFFYLQGYRRDKTERKRDYKTMDIYRNQTKRDGIINMLSTSITSDHTLFPSFGTAEFFEFVLKNPFNQEHTFTIGIDDPELRLVSFVSFIFYPFGLFSMQVAFGALNLDLVCIFKKKVFIASIDL